MSLIDPNNKFKIIKEHSGKVLITYPICILQGRKNTTYETLSVIIERLGISANMLFPSKIPVDDEEIQRFIGKFQACTSENRKILLNTLDCLAEQLLAFHNNFSDE